MRVKYILGFIVALLHGVCNLIILIGCTTDVSSDGIVVSLVEVVDTGEVRWITHIHGVGDGLLARLRIVLASL